MDTIYITGHRNPDTDSVVSAMAYAALKNALGDRQYQAARLGQLSDETQSVLDRFGFKPPKLISNVRTQVRDLDYDTPPTLSAGVTISRAWQTHARRHPASPPSPWPTRTARCTACSPPATSPPMTCSSVRNAYGQRDARCTTCCPSLRARSSTRAAKPSDSISGEVTVALPAARENLLFSDKDSIVVCGEQPDMIRRALELGVNCVIVCQAEVSQELLDMDTETCIITTPYDAYRTVRLICHALPVSRICKTQNLAYFHLDDYIDDVRDAVLKSRFRCLPHSGRE